jgi:hypothetical protein
MKSLGDNLETYIKGREINWTMLDSPAEGADEIESNYDPFNHHNVGERRRCNVQCSSDSLNRLVHQN